MPIFKILTLVIFFLINVALAQYDAGRIKKGGWIYHGINWAVYIAMIAVPWYFFRDWWLVAALLFERLLVFNIALSLYRKLPFDYVSPNPKSIIDRMAKAVFGNNGKLMYAVYLLCFAILIYKTFLI